MTNDPFILALGKDLQPWRSWSFRRAVWSTLAVAAIELVAVQGCGFSRTDLGAATECPFFWWRILGFGSLAVASAWLALRSLRPELPAGRHAIWAIAGLALFFGFGLVFVEGDQSPAGPLLVSHGPICFCVTTMFALPMAICLGILMARGASTDRAGSAWAIGVASAAWGGLLFTLETNHDAPLFVLAALGATSVVLVLASRLALPRLSRW